MTGQYTKLEPLDWDVHSAGLSVAMTGQRNADLWTYISFGPFDDVQGLQTVMSYVQGQLDWENLAIVRKSDNKAIGMASFMRIRPEYGSVEIGCVVFGEELKRSREATEFIYLLGRHLFDDLGYRRFEWKCDSTNAASKRAAERFGFSYEGLFRNDMVVKGRSRDTAWYAIIDEDWPTIKAGYEKWLQPENFDPNGRQIRSLQEFLSAN
jgi:RimJ/RimL family protein N-acetyltransferase